MTSTFSFNRWLLLVGKHWAENHKRYLISLLAMAGMLIIWYLLISFMGIEVNKVGMDMQLSTYYFGLSVIGCLFASQIFKDLSSKTKGTGYLILPASVTEKWLCALFYSVIAFFSAYTLIFYIVDVSMVNIANNYVEKRETAAGLSFTPEKVINVFKAPDQEGGSGNYFIYFLLAYFAIQSVFIMGSIYFGKLSFIKTICIGVGIWFLFFLLLDSILMPMLPQGGFFNDLSIYRIADAGFNETSKEIRLPGWVGDVLIFILKYAFAPLFWVIAFFRLKEKEI